MKRVLRLVIALGIAAIATFGFTSAASAQADDYPTETFGVAGDAVTGSGFTPGSTVTVTLGAEVLGEVAVASDGTFTLAFTPPAACGTYTLTATNGVQTQTSTLTVPCAVTASGSLPYTGSDSLPLLQIGAGLVAAGAVIAIGVRTRNHRAATVEVDA